MADDVLTIIWQSITDQYWPTSEHEAVAAAVAEARNRMPLAHVSMEGLPPPQTSDGYAIDQHGPRLVSPTHSSPAHTITACPWSSRDPVTSTKSGPRPIAGHVAKNLMRDPTRRLGLDGCQQAPLGAWMNV